MTDAAATEVTGPSDGSGRWSPRARTWVLAGVCSLVAAALLTLVPGSGGALHEAPPWMALVVLLGFVLSEPLVFHVEARNEAVSFSPSDIPLAVGLLLLSAPVLVGARIVGAVLALVLWRRPPPFKLALNLGAFALEAAIATNVLHLLAPVTGREGPLLWVGIVLALLSGLLVGGVVIATAISFFEGNAFTRVRREFTHVYLFYVPGAVLGATVAVPYLVAPWLVLVYLVPTAVVWSLLRSHGALRHRFVDLSKIHAFSSRVGRSTHIDDIAAVAVTEIADHMRASSVALVVFGDGGRTVESWLGDRGLLDVLPLSADDPDWAGTLGAAVRDVVDATEVAPMAAALGHESGRKGLVAVIGDDTDEFGVLVAADRTGASAQFDEHDVERLRPLVQQLAVALRKGQLHDQIRYEALHDPLTGVPNRAYFDAWCEQYLADLGPDETAAFLMIDLDRFKEVNDTLGHAVGDLLLIEACERLGDAAGPGAMVSRLGGDEFAIALPDVDEPTLTALVQRMSERLEEPIDLEGTTVSIGASIGIALAPDDGSDVSTVMRRADLAMYDAKQRHERASRYRSELEMTDTTRLGLLGDLRDALVTGAIDVHFQPKIELTTGRVAGVEALARWCHPTEGVLAPEVFVQLAEQSGLIGRLTELVLAKSLAAVASWSVSGHDLTVAVNVSPLSLVGEDFPTMVAAALDRAGVAADRLVLEITERAMIGESQRTLAVLEQLDELGIGLSIDDFGTGYSSLVSLRSMPVSELKIDRRFVAGLVNGGSDGIIVESTIQLAHNLGLTVVAEGVETRHCERLLRLSGCDLAQGYGLCRPLPADEVPTFIEHLVVPAA